MNPVHGLALWVANPAVSISLLAIGLLGIAVEVVTQHGVAGAIGLLSLGIFFAGRVDGNLSQLWFVFLFALGIGLLLVEVHVLPGHGVSGILGLSFILASLVFVLGGNGQAVKEVVISLAITVVVFLALLHYLPKAPIFSRLILQASVETPAAILHDFSKPADEMKALVGKMGTTASELRPSGVVLIENRRYSAMADGEFIPVNTGVKVSRLEGTSLVVHKQN